MKVWALSTSLTPTCSKSWKWAIMQLCAVEFVSFEDVFRVYNCSVSEVCFLHFISHFRYFFHSISKKGCRFKWAWETFNFTLRHKYSAFITILHFTVTIESSIMSTTHILKWNDSLTCSWALLSMNAAFCSFDVIWYT